MKNEFNILVVGVLLLAGFYCNPLFSQDNEIANTSVVSKNILVLEPGFTGTKTNATFKKKYHYLVARAYFRLLSEAQKSERKLKAEFNQYTVESDMARQQNNSLQEKLELTQKKYEAHRAMLFGLKSWNLFSDDRTGDMFYFMVENEDRIFQMHQREISETKMVKFLIYRLADLYHIEGQS